MVNLKVFRPRGSITVRHVAFVLAFSLALWTIYYAYLNHSESLFPREHVFFWPSETPEVWADRAAQVKSAFLHAYHGYEQYAFPRDEIRPISNTSIDNFNGWGVTAVDSLDTMLLMGLKNEYARAIPMIMSTNFSMPTNTDVPFFETVIRYLGGLLSAYALSMDTVLRDKADELATKLSPAFDTLSGFPRFSVNTYNSGRTHPKPFHGPGQLAEISSFQLEYAYLGKITGKQEHVDRVATVNDLFRHTNLSLSGDMYPIHWNIYDGKPSNIRRLSVGAAADSAHEYTLKQFLLTARSDKAHLEAYLKFTTYVIDNLLFVSSQRDLLYVTDSITRGNRTAASHQFEHLSCFFPGLLALGAHLLPLDDLESVGIDFEHLGDAFPPGYRAGFRGGMFNLSDLHLWAAEGIAQTCYLTYADQPSGLGPDVITMRVARSGEIRWMEALRKWRADGKLGPPPGVGDKRPWVANPKAKTVTEMRLDTMSRDYGIKNTAYYLRPETIESFYILWRTTGDVKWRYRGWSVFQAIERVAKVPSGYSSVDRVNTMDPILQDSMPSYFLAETLKYLYLLFLDDDIVPLDKWVFNTEAHPLPVFAWTETEKDVI